MVSTTSFDHWADQAARLAECARVLAPGGRLVLADQFSLLLWPTLLAGRRGKARTRARATRLVTAAGLRSPRWHRVHAVIIQAVTAVRWRPAQPRRSRNAAALTRFWHAVEQNRLLPLREVSTYTRSQCGAVHTPSRS